MAKIEINSNKTQLSHSEVVEKLVELGYTRCQMVLEPGDFAVRGAIIDIYASNQSHPLRIEYFGNEIDRINTFNIHTQTALSVLEKCDIHDFKEATEKKSAPLQNEDLLLNFKEGDYVVHEDHGIGLYKGLVHLKVSDFEGEYCLLEYQNNDKVYMPLSQLEQLHHYDNHNEAPTLSNLKTITWKKNKEKAQRAIILIAEDVYRTYQIRQKESGFAFKEDSVDQIAFESEFEHPLTPDQHTVLTEVKNDMEAALPMERLLCGEVGFGKTEVILRAAFKAVDNEKQVAILVPTTLLAKQHTELFKHRFKNYPFRVEMLSRLVPKKEQNKLIKEIKAHKVDVIIATHQLLRKDIEYSDLGLLVIDEEQRFGVHHKERIKQRYPSIDIISISATPIPRTLYMALTGSKALSSINTPPLKRKAIATHIGCYDENILKKAITDEIKRGGKLYYLYNTVEKMAEKKVALMRLFPDLNIQVAHGQLKQSDLESAMQAFLSDSGNILLCSSIIENGLDIPNANTIIIENVDRFGVGQLHQLRGRVGRSKKQGYAYFFHSQNQLTEEAEKRLEAIKTYTALGSGYKLALKDLEIRGAGTMLGNQQSGHLTNIGFDLYCKLLQNEIQRKKDPSNTAKKALLENKKLKIDYSYIANDPERLAIYKRLYNVTSQNKLNGLLEELKDRYGPIPKSLLKQLVN